MWTRLITLLLITSTALPLSAQATVPNPDVWRTVTAVLEPGALIVLKTRDGHRMKGTLLQRTGDAILLQEKTRIAVPPREVPLTSITAIERSRSGWSPGVKVV